MKPTPPGWPRISASVHYEEARPAIDLGDVAERPDHEAALRQLLVRAVDPLAKVRGHLAHRQRLPPQRAWRSRTASSLFMSVPSSARAPETLPNVSCSSRYIR